MPFHKEFKNKAYFKRFQVKYKRRREGKTDYAARTKMIIQDKNKFNSPKYRFVVRVTNTDVITQIIYSKIVGDVVLKAAYSHELPKYGIKLGLTNYAACYATGLLLARRVLTHLKLADKYKGVEKPTGAMAIVKPIASADKDSKAPRPFKVVMDIGLVRTSTGAKVFGALKGLSDGGVYIKHDPKRFVGYDMDKNKFDAAMLRKYIFGGHVAEYMKELKKEDPQRYAKQFSRYVAAGIEGGHLEKIYSDAHAAIRKDPSFTPTKKPEKPVHKRYGARKLTYAERKQKIRDKLIALRKFVTETQ